MDTFEKFKKSTKVLNYSLDPCGEDDHCVMMECSIETDVGKFNMDLPWFYECGDPKDGLKKTKEVDADPIKFVIKYIEDSYDEKKKKYNYVSYLTDLETKTSKTSKGSKSTENTLCKYGKNCTNGLCKFDHPEDRVIQDCRYGDKCTNAKCKFKHSDKRVLTKCKFGTKCTNKKCHFEH